MIAGVDLSLTGTGLAKLHDGELTTKRVPSSGATKDSLLQRFDRQSLISDEVLAWCQGADLVVIETLFTAKNAGALIDRAGLWWRIVGSLHLWKVPVLPVSTTQGKKFLTGSGSADKGTMVLRANKTWPSWEPTSAKHSDDEADAIALASIGLAMVAEGLTNGLEQLPFDLPEYRREVMRGLSTVWMEAWAS